MEAMHMSPCRQRRETSSRRAALRPHRGRRGVEQLASSAVLTDDEKNWASAVDIGGGCTDIAVFSGGAIRHTVDPHCHDVSQRHRCVHARRRGTPRTSRYACLRCRSYNPEGIEVRGVATGPRAALARRAGGGRATTGTIRPDPRRAARSSFESDRGRHRDDRWQRAHGRRH